MFLGKNEWICEWRCLWCQLTRYLQSTVHWLPLFLYFQHLLSTYPMPGKLLVLESKTGPGSANSKTGLPSVPPLDHFRICHILIASQAKCFLIFEVCLQMTITLPTVQTPQFLAHGRHSNMRTRGWLHLTVQAPQEGWTNPLGLEIRPGQVALPICAFHVHVKMASLCTWRGVINTHPPPPLLSPLPRTCISSSSDSSSWQWNGLSLI